MIQNPISNQVSGIRQKELFLQKDRSYPFAVVVKVQQPLDVRVALTNADGTQIYAETVFPVQPVLATVSYTHLDVYKRQLILRAIVGISDADTGIDPCFVDIKSTTVEPVSYTHLDVYKRQLLCYILY